MKQPEAKNFVTLSLYLVTKGGKEQYCAAELLAAQVRNYQKDVTAYP
jgi:hypothetical protein